MSLEKLLNHTCDIYHIIEGESSPGYGLETSPSFSYPEEPDIQGQICHFQTTAGQNVNRNAPQTDLDTRAKLTLPIGTDVRLNDRIVNCNTGYQYTAEVPVNVRDHHLFVYVRREDVQKPV